MKKSLLLLYHHVYCDPEVDRDDEEMRLINQITESMKADIKEICLLLTNSKGKDGSVSSNQKCFIKLTQHTGVNTMREVIIDYIINALLPVMETTIVG